jgi:hypothetical protein
VSPTFGGAGGGFSLQREHMIWIESRRCLQKSPEILRNQTRPTQEKYGQRRLYSNHQVAQPAPLTGCGARSKNRRRLTTFECRNDRKHDR